MNFLEFLEATVRMAASIASDSRKNKKKKSGGGNSSDDDDDDSDDSSDDGDDDPLVAHTVAVSLSALIKRFKTVVTSTGQRKK